MHKRVIRTTFLKYLFSYGLSFLLPLFFSFLILNQWFVSTYRGEVLNNERAQNITFQNSMDARIQQIYAMAEQISLDEEFRSSIGGSTYQDFRRSRRLFTYSAINSFVNNVVYLRSNEDMVITSKGTSSKGTLDSYLFRYADMPAPKLFEMAGSVSKPTWLPFQRITYYGDVNTDCASFFYPLSEINGTNNLLLFQITEDSFNDNIAISRSSPEKVQIILTGNGALFYASQPCDAALTAVLDSLETYDRVPSFLEEQGYFLSCSQSEETGFTYISALPIQSAMEKVDALRRIILWLYVGIFLLGMGVISLLMRWNYHPIRNLRACLERSSAAGSSSSGTVIDAASAAISMLQESDIQLQRRIFQNQKALASTMLCELLWGHYNNILEFNRFGEDYGVHAPGSRFYLALFHFGQSHAPEERLGVLNALQERFEQVPVFCIGVEDSDKNMLAMLLSTDDLGEQPLESVVNGILAWAATAFSLSLTAGLSHACSPEENISFVYMETAAALQFAGAYPEETVLRPEIPDPLSTSHYPSVELQAMQNALEKQDASTFLAESSFVLECACSPHMSLLMGRLLLFELVNSIVKSLRSMGRRTELVLLTETVQPMIAKNLTNQEMRVELQQAMQTLAGTLQEKTPMESDQITYIKSYIQENYGRYDFSLQALADEFGMSLSNIGQYFKKNTGLTLSEYLGRQKHDEAKRLLRTTDLPLEEIIHRIGYVSVSSFIRRFRQESHMTPGEYRERHGSKNK